MIELKNMNFGYVKKQRIFRDISIELTEGHIYGLLGKNGAGKTTLLKIMAGLRFPESGSTMVMEQRAELRKAEMLQEIYFLQEEMFVPHLTIRQFAKIYAPFYPKFCFESYTQYLNDFEIKGQDDYLDKLSHGQKKKVLICFALASNTNILIMDEPTNGLDIPSKTIFRRVMAAAANEERMIIISTHQVRDLHSLIDVVIILDNGEIILNESTDRITEKLAFELNDDDSAEDALYVETNLRGFYTVRENKQEIDTKLDIELLFNAVIKNKQKIKEIFNK